MNILSKLSERLKELIEEADIKKSQLAEKLNLDHSVLSRYLRAERLPSTTTLVKLADYFNCMTDYILGFTDVLDEREFKQRPPFSEQLGYLLDYFKVSKYRLEKDKNISEETVNNWHKGIYEPTVENLIKLAEYFNCSIDFVLGREV